MSGSELLMQTVWAGAVVILRLDLGMIYFKLASVAVGMPRSSPALGQRCQFLAMGTAVHLFSQSSEVSNRKRMKALYYYLTSKRCSTIFAIFSC